MKKKVTIHIGEYFASGEPTIIHTILGSCVAVCLYDPFRRIGGMNHILLPGRVDLKRYNSPARYGINAMELLINRIMALGADRHRLVAKVFGGAHILPGISEENGVGKKNAAFAVQFLQMESIEIISRDLEGYESRKIYFHTDTGEVFLKRIPSSVYPGMVVEEQEVLKRIRSEIKKPGKTTLFWRRK
jgi:chemotaxis protein CheD